MELEVAPSHFGKHQYRVATVEQGEEMNVCELGYRKDEEVQEVVVKN